jgi:hypothetical protein
MLHEIANACGDILRIVFDGSIVAFAVWLWLKASEPA